MTSTAVCLKQFQADEAYEVLLFLFLLLLLLTIFIFFCSLNWSLKLGQVYNKIISNIYLNNGSSCILPLSSVKIKSFLINFLSRPPFDDCVFYKHLFLCMQLCTYFVNSFTLSCLIHTLICIVILQQWLFRVYDFCMCFFLVWCMVHAMSITYIVCAFHFLSFCVF